MNKKFAPTLITIIACIICLAFFGPIAVMSILTGELIVIIFGLIFGICVIGVVTALIINLVRRYQEINKEDKDNDLSQY